MNPLQDTSPFRRLGRYLIAGYTLLIVYASLSPFSGWREQGLGVFDVLSAPLGQTYTPLDAIANLLAYIPLGLLLALSLRTRYGAGRGVLLSTLGGTLLSASMEFVQMYLPMRTSSNLDLLTNSSGTLLGAMLAMMIAPSTWFARLARGRQHLLRRGNAVDFGLALFILWMFAQINPSLPMLGNIFIGETAKYPFPPFPAAPFNWPASFAVALNLLMLGCLLITLMQNRRHSMIALMLVISTVAAGKFIAAVLLLKSWALLLWLNSEAMLGIIAGLIVLALAARLPERLVSWCAALSAFAYLVIGVWVLDSGAPASTLPLYHWKEGHLLTYNGLSHNILLLFPLLMLGYLWHSRKQPAAAV
ncbi:MAG TPA: VanZ family protein [Gallionellaceae bacterium]